jgi:PAS domain S-box-containing protein
VREHKASGKRSAGVQSKSTAGSPVETEEELDSPKLLQILARTLPIGICMVQDGCIKFTSAQFRQMLGYYRGELTGTELLDLIVADDRELMRDTTQQVLEKQVTFSRECRFTAKSGEIQWVTLIVSPFLYQGKAAILCYPIDITRQKAAYVALRESEEFSSTLFRLSPVPVHVLNRDTSVRYINPSFEKLTGFSFAEVVGLKAPYPWWPEDATAHTRKILAKGLTIGLTKDIARFARKDGEQMWVEITSVPVRSDGRLKYYLSTWVDITKEKQLKENMQFYIDEITRAQEEERKRIARDLHDETVQTLSSLFMEAHDILAKSDDIPAHVRKRLEHLAAIINNTVEEVRRFTKELRPGLLDKLGLIPSLEIMVDEYCDNTEVNYLFTVTGSERRLAPETEVILFRIAQEALNNLLKHARATKTVLNIDFAEDEVVFLITDNGCGFVLPDELGDFARSGKLGLISMNERVHLLNGNFWVQSQPGSGTTITVKIPYHQ